MKKIKATAFLSALMLMVCGTSCASSKTSEPKAKMSVICKSTDPYWDSVKKAVQDASEEMNLSVSYEAPEREDYSAQINMINQAVASGTQAIIIAPVVESELNDALLNAVQKGIPVITIDSDVSLPERTCFIGTLNESAASAAGRYVLEMADDDAVIAVITHDTISQTAAQRTNGFLNVFSRDDVPQTISILDPLNCEGDIQKTEDNVTALLKEHPEIDIIYATNQPTTVGVCQAVNGLVSSGDIQPEQVRVVGFDYFDGAETYLENGVLSAVVVQNPYNMGYFGVRFAWNILNGESVEPIMDTGTSLVTTENLNNQDIQFLLHPAS